MPPAHYVIPNKCLHLLVYPDAIRKIPISTIRFRILICSAHKLRVRRLVSHQGVFEDPEVKAGIAATDPFFVRVAAISS
jgi:hypothetical protein